MKIPAAYRRGVELLKQHGLDKWRLRFTRRIAQLGATHFADRVICVNAPLILANDTVKFEETMLHEIAHAIMGSSWAWADGDHGPEWQRIAKDIGCEGRRIADMSRYNPAVYYISQIRAESIDNAWGVERARDFYEVKILK